MCASQTRLFPRQWALCCKTARCGYSDDEIKNIDFNRPFQKERHLLLADVFLFGFISRRIQPDELKLYSWYAKSFPLTVLSLLSQLICRSGAVRIPTAPENLPPILCQSVISDRSGSSSDSLAVPGPCGSRGRPASEARQESPAQPLSPGPAPRFYLPRPRYASGGR